ncbi:hypothetical protein [Ectopseudomonas khazarica]|uniref:hypothetical protein n=1 Tax=Ectopseudomonas khazarica TaxID=2502979 RepID=UPI003B93D442
MERSPIMLGVSAAVIALLLVKLVKAILGSHLANFMLEAAYNLPWLAGGFVAGYRSRLALLKNGAIAGAFYGGVLCLIGMALISTRTHGVQEKVSQLGFSALAIVRFSIMFSLASAFGYLQRRREQLSNNALDNHSGWGSLKPAP